MHRSQVVACVLLFLAVVATGSWIKIMDGKHGPCTALPILLSNHRTNSTVMYGTNHGLPPGVYPNSCKGASLSSGSMWYSITTPPNTAVSISTCGVYTNFPVLLSVYDSQSYCSSPNCELYSTGSSSDSTCAIVEYLSTGYHLFSVSGIGNATGDYQLTISVGYNSTSTCSNPIILPPTDFIVPVSVYLSSGQTAQCGSMSFEASWFSLTLDKPSGLFVTRCFEDNLRGKMAIYSGTCNSLKCVEANSDGDCIIGSAFNQGTYLIAVSGVYDNIVTFAYSVRKIIPFNNCKTPESETVYPYGGFSLPFYTLGQDDITNDPCGKATGPSYWYLLNTSQIIGRNLTLSTCDSATDFDTTMQVYGGDCTALTCIAHNDDANCAVQPGASAITIAVSLSQYYVVIAGVNGASGIGQFSCSSY